MMTEKETRSGARRGHVDAKQVELLISLACKADTFTLSPKFVEQPRPNTTTAPTFSPAHRDSLTEVMIDLIFAPDAF
jgi:hypothetical protein